MHYIYGEETFFGLESKTRRVSGEPGARKKSEPKTVRLGMKKRDTGRAENVIDLGIRTENRVGVVTHRTANTKVVPGTKNLRIGVEDPIKTIKGRIRGTDLSKINIENVF